MHFVIKAIESYWKKIDLAPYERYELSQLVKGCQEILDDLEGKLDKYRSLGSNWKNPFDRIRWAAKDIAPIRVKLMQNSLSLSTFNATLANHSQGNRIQLSEARILQKLNEIQVAFEEGKRDAPAFSSVNAEDLDQEKTWQSITKELEDTKLEPGSISSNQAFIRSWIDQVILMDDQEPHTMGPLSVSIEEQGATGREIQVAAPRKTMMMLQERQSLVNQFEVDEPGVHVGHTRFRIERYQIWRYWKRKRTILGIGLGVAIIIAIVLAIILSRRHKGSTKASQASLSKRNIAALSFQSKYKNHTNLYFQSNSGQLREAASSPTDPSWTINEIGVTGKNGTPIAAAVSRLGFPLEISVFYLDNNNLINDVIYTNLTRKWTPGVVSKKGYYTLSNSSLTAMYNQCRNCANTTIIAFQDPNGLVKIGNLTGSDDWSLTPLGSALNPQLGTGLALCPHYLNGLADQINLFHQKSGLDLALASQEQPFGAWLLNVQTYNTAPPGTHISAAASYTKASSGYETWIEVLSVFDQGIQVGTWSGAINDWLLWNTNNAAMLNSTSNKKVYGGVAVTATGSAFAVVSQDERPDEIEHWQVSDDMITWNSTGIVDLGGAWD